MKHPSETQLVLHASGDLPRLEGWRVQRHVSRCASCRSAVDGFMADQDWLREAGNMLPPGVDWQSLSAEMTANIHVGLVAGQCVAPVAAKFPVWRWAAAAACSAALLAGGWYLNPTAKSANHVVYATETGVELRGQSGALVLQGPQDKRPGDVRAVFTSGVDMLGAADKRGTSYNTLGARFVDDTGQVQVVRVYEE
jgi:hypothetical protein